MSHSVEILREINFGESRSCKTAILALLETLNFGYFVNCGLPKVQIFTKIIIQSI